MELLAKLGIDWSLLVAQVVNFLILIGVLSFFVYKPLLHVLDARRERIAKAMEHANKVEQQAKELEAQRTTTLRKVDQEAGAMLEKSKQQAERMKQEILESAKREADQMLEKARKQLDDERVRVFAEVQGVVAKMIVRMTEKILEREFSKTDQDRLLGSLEKELPTLLR
ncbi:F0F1 ATP synthase subunit B [Candidatus Peregrinibacteria bacterium]|nr:F0F1 ATP synthase subunit B [Candidatus Peregrinibacteria bacterium]